MNAFPLYFTFQNDVTANSMPADSISFPEVYFPNGIENLDALLYLILGALVTFTYLGFNKYHSIWAQQEEIDPNSSTTKKKFENVSYIWFRKFKSLVFRHCFYNGLIGAVLFVLILVADLSAVGGFYIPEGIVVKSGIPVIDFIFAGLIFGFIVYPVLTGNIVSQYGLRMVSDVLNPTDGDIYDDIDNSRRDYIKHKVKKLEKENDRDFTIQDFKKKIKVWYQLQQREETNSAELLAALTNADDYFSDDVVNYIASVMKSFGDERVKRALDYNS